MRRHLMGITNLIPFVHQNSQIDLCWKLPLHSLNILTKHWKYSHIGSPADWQLTKRQLVPFRQVAFVSVVFLCQKGNHQNTYILKTCITFLEHSSKTFKIFSWSIQLQQICETCWHLSWENTWFYIVCALKFQENNFISGDVCRELDKH